MTTSKYAEYLTWSVEELENLLRTEPNNIPANNAIRTLKHEAAQKKTLQRLGKKASTTSGHTAHHSKPNHRWCPTKKVLR